MPPRGKQRPPADPCLACGKGEHRGYYHRQLSRPDYHPFQSTRREVQQRVWLQIAQHGAHNISHEIGCAIRAEYQDCGPWLMGLLTMGVRIDIIDAVAAPILSMIDEHCRGLRWSTD